MTIFVMSPDLVDNKVVTEPMEVDVGHKVLWGVELENQNSLYLTGQISSIDYKNALFHCSIDGQPHLDGLVVIFDYFHFAKSHDNSLIIVGGTLR